MHKTKGKISDSLRHRRGRSGETGEHCADLIEVKEAMEALEDGRGLVIACSKCLNSIAIRSAYSHHVARSGCLPSGAFERADSHQRFILRGFPPANRANSRRNVRRARSTSKLQANAAVMPAIEQGEAAAAQRTMIKRTIGLPKPRRRGSEAVDYGGYQINALDAL